MWVNAFELIVVVVVVERESVRRGLCVGYRPEREEGSCTRRKWRGGGLRSLMREEHEQV